MHRGPSQFILAGFRARTVWSRPGARRPARMLLRIGDELAQVCDTDMEGFMPRKGFRAGVQTTRKPTPSYSLGMTRKREVYGDSPGVPRRKWPDGPSPRNSENQASCSISSLRMARESS
jgi:hypothetical protein